MKHKTNNTCSETRQQTMSSPRSERPVYVNVKKRKKRQRNERLHGAFTGGFSAGHFNTVGSKNGWRPSDTDGMEMETEAGEEEEQQQFGFDSGTSRSGGSKLLFSSSKKRKIKSKSKVTQRPEDFMDEEDANEWGGPVKVKDSYHGTATTKTSSSLSTTGGDIIKDSSSLRKLLYSKKKKGETVSSAIDSVGKQLLKVLGWREDLESSSSSSGGAIKSYAYVPLDDGEVVAEAEKSLLSSKRLKRIEMQLSSHERDFIPPPKIDTYGMGYEPYKNAPEFKAHREMRKKRAEERARAASSTNGGSRMNVYNMGTLDDDDDNNDEFNSDKMGRSNKQKNESNTILAYETMEDFIGAKGVGGFALHDDDDQVYDHSEGHSASLFNKGEQRSKINKSEYQNEAFEGSDSDVDVEDNGYHFMDDDKRQHRQRAQSEKVTKETSQKIQSFTGALNAWASEGNNTNSITQGNVTTAKNANVKAVTSDGEVPLAGFELGGINSNTTKRYPGPDVPADYAVKRHTFSASDAMSMMKELSSLMKQQLKSKNSSRDDNTASYTSSSSSHQRDNMEPIAGKSFAALSGALKNRFVSSKRTKQDDSNVTTEAAAIDPRKVKVTRTTISWQPSHLLLKRFNIKSDNKLLAASSNISNQSQQEQNRSTIETREEAFFRNEVLGQLQATTVNESDTNVLSLEKQSLSAESVPIERPSLDLMRSIFEESSEDDSIGDDEEKLKPSPLLIEQQQQNISKSDSIDEGVELLDTNASTNQPSSPPRTKSVREQHHESSDSSSSPKRKKSRKKSSKSRTKKRKKSKSKKKDVR